MKKETKAILELKRLKTIEEEFKERVEKEKREYTLLESCEYDLIQQEKALMAQLEELER